MQRQIMKPTQNKEKRWIEKRQIINKFK